VQPWPGRRNGAGRLQKPRADASILHQPNLEGQRGVWSRSDCPSLVWRSAEVRHRLPTGASHPSWRGNIKLPLHIIDGRTVEPHRRSVVAILGHFLVAPFSVAWHHRDLIAAILRRELHERFKGSVAGWIWAVFAPLLSLVMYTVAFSGLVKLPGDAGAGPKADFALFIFGGLVAFNFFTEMAYRAPSLLHEYSHFIKQTMFPAEMLAIISTLRATAYASIALVLMLIAQVVISGTLYWTVVALPLWLALFVAFLIGITWTLSAMGAFTRDASYLMMTIAPLLMFVSPVFFAPEALTPTTRLLLYANPLTGFIEIVRDLVVFGSLPSLVVCSWTATCSAVAFWFGFWFFTRNRDGISDVI
jgi:lipopolysaccharide transport system permease protein